jgi:holliday junction DNA helicase RuvA
VIALLSGEVAVRRSDHVVISCAGVGYRAMVSAETLHKVAPVGERATLHTHLIVREDAISLYGFHSEQERELFLMLISVQAVGPKVAMALLSGGTPQELVRALAAGDTERLRAVPGIGKRTAERIIVELREKVVAGIAGTASDGGALGAIAARRGDGASRSQIAGWALARDGLLELGYNAIEAEELLRDVEGSSAEELIAGALRAARA